MNVRLDYPMVMKQIAFTILSCALFFVSCSSDQSTVDTKTDTHATEAEVTNASFEAMEVSASGENGTCSYFTKDQDGNTVLCWSESGKEKEDYQLRYATFDPATKEFGNPVTVGPSKGMQAHCESMAKVAFRPDGSVVAVFRFSTPTETNRFAGGIFYSQSFDHGTTWTEKSRLVDGDVSASQSYFDLAVLDHGEIAMVWLDGRKLNPEQNGSCLVYGETSGQEGFAIEKILKAGVCQCCRTDFYRSSDARLHIAYRDILNDSIRDMAYLVSSDDGASFTEPTTIYDDGWVIDGCPHTGPSLAWNGSELANVWFTQGGGKGIYFTTMDDRGKAVGDKELITPEGAHPQMVALPDGKYAIAMEYFVEEGTDLQIVLYTREKGESFSRQEIGAANSSGKFPVLSLLDTNQLLVAWTDESEDMERVIARIVDLSPVSM